MKPKIYSPAIETEVSTPPVVAESVETETKANYDQQASRRKGLLSTILSNRRLNATANAGGNSTLG